MSERRYTEEEVAEIFERASEPRPEGPGRAPAPASGLTLPELREIGREVGIAPEAVADAARSLEPSAERSAGRTFLGFPIGVGRALHLDRQLTEEEWERLVVDLRETFDARGRIRSEGSFREWANGNLQALVEPTADGERVRLRTFREMSRNFMMAGLGVLGVAAAALIAGLLSAGLEEAARVVPLVVIGLGLLGVGAVPLPGWARLRERQMEEVLSRLRRTASGPAGEPPEELPPGTDAPPGGA
ncbi:MAG TPA: hypothetical protein VKB18_10245 [Gemmatimonadota bacterium]|nr:hypothetical protein [Gemmatimonadota bacterium]